MRTLRMPKHSPLKSMIFVSGLLAVTWGGLALQPKDANAEIRVRAKVHTPVGKIYVDSGPRHHQEGRRQHWNRRPGWNRRPVVVQHQPYHQITRYDRQVAWRLSRLTQFESWELLDLRRAGYSWQKVGRMLRIGPRLVKAAKDPHKFQRYFRRHGRNDGFGVCYHDD